MNRITIRSRVGGDGVLHVEVPLGASEADREVQIVIEPAGPADLSQEEWRRRILQMAGQWQGDFERPEQGDYETRDTLP